MRYECTTGGSSKFWEAEVAGIRLLVKFGKIGTKGQTKERMCGSAAEARAELERCVKEKIKKGYVPVKSLSNGNRHEKEDKKSKKTLTIRFASYARNQGDGSVSVNLFENENLAEKNAEKDDERSDEDIESHELVIDLETGKIISGVETKAEKDED